MAFHLPSAEWNRSKGSPLFLELFQQVFEWIRRWCSAFSFQVSLTQLAHGAGIVCIVGNSVRIEFCLRWQIVTRWYEKKADSPRLVIDVFDWIGTFPCSIDCDRLQEFFVHADIV